MGPNTVRAALRRGAAGCLVAASAIVAPAVVPGAVSHASAAPGGDSLEIETAADMSAVEVAGDLLTVDYTVVNTGGVNLTAVELTDSLPGLGAIVCGDFDGTIASGDAVSCSATYEVSQGDLDGEQVSS